MPERPWAWGTSSSTTTYSMAPAAKASSHGMTGVSRADRITASTAATGSTAPDSTPPANAFSRERPA